MVRLDTVLIINGLCFGLLTVLIVASKKAWADALGVDEIQVGRWRFFTQAAFVPLVVLAGWFADTIGAKPTMLLGQALAAAGVFAAAIMTDRRFMAFPLTGVAAGTAFLGTGAIVLMPEGFFPANLSASLNLGMAFFALGSLITPAFLSPLFRLLGFRRTWCLIALLGCLAPGIVTGLATAGPEPSLDIRETLHSPLLHIVVSGLVLGIYLPLEKLPGRWGRLYLGENRFPADKVHRCLVGFWLAFVLSRILIAFLLERGYINGISDAGLVLILSLAAMTLLVVLTGAQHRGDIKVFFLMMGAFLGPILPTLIANLFHLTGPFYRGFVFSLALAIASVIYLSLSFLLEAAMQSQAKQHVYVAPTIFAFVLAFAALTLAVL